jgi:hypothetical protein
VNRRALLRYAGIGAAVVVVVGVAVAAFISLQTPFQLPTVSPSSQPCSPQPCADIRGFILWVGDVKVDSGVVSMTLTFQNASSSTHADPTEIQLLDSAGKPNDAVHDIAGCTAWPRTDFDNGAKFGPVPECFRPASTSPPLRLHWEPDFGFFCCDTDIALTS